MVPPTKTTEQEPGEQNPRPLDGQFREGTQTPDQGASPSAAETRAMTPAPADTTRLSATTSTGPPALVTASSDHCAVCGAQMAADQRYCLECGERRGQARFAAPTAPASTAMTSTRTTAAQHGSRWSPGATLIAGVATLLLAMGIGVLIGHETASSSPAQTSAKAPVVYLNGGGSAAAASTAAPATTAPTGNAGSSGSSNKSSKSHKNANSSASSSTAAAATTPTTVKKLPPATVTVGAKGSGPGYQHGKFTGNFFGN
jgi:hypothetical protein